jgi:hypothetical protein
MGAIPHEEKREPADDRHRCEKIRQGRSLVRQISYTACVRDAISAAVVKVNQPTLNAYHEAKTHRRNATIQIAQK